MFTSFTSTLGNYAARRHTILINLRKKSYDPFILLVNTVATIFCSINGRAFIFYQFAHWHSSQQRQLSKERRPTTTVIKTSNNNWDWLISTRKYVRHLNSYYAHNDKGAKNRNASARWFLNPLSFTFSRFANWFWKSGQSATRETCARARNYKVSVQMKMKVSANYGSSLCITVVVASRKQ
jgi:hypothetical protein